MNNEQNNEQAKVLKEEELKGINGGVRAYPHGQKVVVGANLNPSTETEE